MRNLLNQIGIVAVALAFATTACNNKPAETTTQNEEPTISNATPETPAPGTVPGNVSTSDKYLSIQTTAGLIKIRLYKECPLHQANFIKLVNEKFYDGVLFHRVIKGFMIQTGDPDSKAATPGAQYGAGGPGYTIPAEINLALHHKKGALAAARQSDEVNPYKASSGSQFYIVQGQVMTREQLNQMGKPFTVQAFQDYTTIGGTPMLDNDYTVFGEVTEGLDVVDKIGNTATLPGDRPKKDIKITGITIDPEQ